MLKYFTPMYPFILGTLLILAIPQFHEITLVNLLAQTLIFTFLVCIPAWKTGRLSYVDIGWPMGLMAIGIVIFTFSEGDLVRKLIVSAVYVFAGARMLKGSVSHWLKGGLKVEYPRYTYQRRRWEKAGKTNTMLAIQVDAIVQGMVNVSFLAIPALIISANPTPDYSIFEILGLIVWLAAFIMETTADRQKHAFIEEMQRLGEKNKVCNVGLWNYSRHPNYFAEWMVWNALIIASIPSLLALYDDVTLVLWILLAASLLYVSRIMYTCLVLWTGAVPSEYYSVQKRPDYKEYQQTTNMFFPGPTKK